MSIAAQLHAGKSDAQDQSIYSRAVGKDHRRLNLCWNCAARRWIGGSEPEVRGSNLVVLLRILISLAIAVLGAMIPGFLEVDWKGRAVPIRRGGAFIP